MDELTRLRRENHHLREATESLVKEVGEMGPEEMRESSSGMLQACWYMVKEALRRADAAEPVDDCSNPEVPIDYLRRQVKDARNSGVREVIAFLTKLKDGTKDYSPSTASWSDRLTDLMFEIHRVLLGEDGLTYEQKWHKRGYQVDWSDEVRAYQVFKLTDDCVSGCETYRARTVQEVDKFVMDHDREKEIGEPSTPGGEKK